MRSERGFTLIEMILVVALIATIGAIAVPALSESTNRNSVWTASEQIGSQIRQARLKHLGMSNDSEYGKRNHINTEIAYSREIFRKHPNWPVIDVTNRAIEETAADILRIYQERMNPDRATA